MAYTAIDDPGIYFNTVLYTGDDEETNSISGVGFEPDFIWVKSRSTAVNHIIMDSVRGFGTGKKISPNFDQDEGSASNVEDGGGYITATGSDGYNITTSDVSNWVHMNKDSVTYVSWNWKETATAGFDIVSYTGTGSAKTESHSLSAVPHFIIVKNRSDVDAWRVYHHKNTAAPETDYLVLDTGGATTDDATAWNDTAPTSSVFSVGTSDQTNENTDSFIAYLFSEKQGFSKFGSFVGNGNADGAFVYTGFKPAFLLIKTLLGAGGSNWLVLDNKRSNPFNEAAGPDAVYANLANVESAVSPWADLLSNGFKCLAWNEGNVLNASGVTYVYAAFAESPFVNSNGVPCNAR